MSWLPKNTVVVPIDFSEECFAALDTARELVSLPTQVHVVHVLQELAVGEIGEMWRTIDDESRRQHTENALRERLAKTSVPEAQLHILFGDPGSEITELAQKLHADLVVLTSHGRTGLRRLLIGSVAERVVRLAHCPVLVLRN